MEHAFLHVLGTGRCVVTGTAASTNDADAWVTRSADFLKRAADAAVPMYGVCFGHQHLAHNPQTACQAFALGDAIWGTQFHPEFMPEVVHALIGLLRTDSRPAPFRRGRRTSSRSGTGSPEASKPRLEHGAVWTTSPRLFGNAEAQKP